MEANKRTINDIFNGNRLLEVPYYQRSYVWGEKQWKRFLEDMENASLAESKPYFIGSIILKQQPTSSSAGIGDKRTVIDGQQRLTTMTVFFKVLSLLKDNASIFDSFLVEKSDDDEEESEKEIALMHNHIDKDAFNQIVNLKTSEDLGLDDHGKLKSGNNQIINLYQYLLANIDPAKYNSKRIKSKVLFVAIDLTHEEDEQQIFDTINSLGVTLTTSELLKNYFFNRNNFSDYEKYWFPIFEKDEDQKKYWDQEIVSGNTRTHLNDMFFAAYLTIKTHDEQYGVTTEDKLRFARVQDLFESYKSFIHKYLHDDKMQIIGEIKQYALTFMKYFNPDCKDEALTGEPGFERINLMIFAQETTSIVPYALYILMTVSDEYVRNQIFGYIESYFMRRVICHSDTRGYFKLFQDSLLTNSIQNAEALQDYLNNKSEDRVIASPLDEDVVNSVMNTVLVNKQNTAVLYMLESRLMANSPHATTLLGYRYYTLEHLMPKKWQNTWDTNLPTETIELRNRRLWTLGNLTIIPGKLNISVSNNTWDIKVNGKGNKPGLKSNASGLITLNKYLSLPAWDETEIDKRAQDLTDLILQTWKRTI